MRNEPTPDTSGPRPPIPAVDYRDLVCASFADDLIASEARERDGRELADAYRAEALAALDVITRLTRRVREQDRTIERLLAKERGASEVAA